MTKISYSLDPQRSAPLRISRRAGLLVGALLPCEFLRAQSLNAKSSAERALLGNQALPSYLQEHALALGERLRKAGQEQLSQAGDLRVAAASSPVNVVRQLPNKLRVDIAGSRARALLFDGADSRGTSSLDDLDEEIIESFTENTVEGLLAEITAGASNRLLGTSFRPDPRKFPNYTGPSYTIVEMTQVSKSRSLKTQQMKRFYFDTSSNLLLRTVYGKNSSGRIALHETRYGDWKPVAGNIVPHRVEKLVDGQQRFVFTAGTSTLGALAPDSRFSALTL